MKRGARVFEVTQDPYSIKTWIREDGGSIANETVAHKRKLFDFPQTQCCGMAKPSLIEHINDLLSARERLATV